MKASTNLTSLFLSSGYSNLVIDSCAFDGNYRNQSYSSATLVRGIFIQGGNNNTVRDSSFYNFGNFNTTESNINGGTQIALWLYGSTNAKIYRNRFWSNFGTDLSVSASVVPNSDGAYVVGNILGSPSFTEGAQGTNWWDTHSAGYYGLSVSFVSNATITNNTVYGGMAIPNGTYSSLNPFIIQGCNNCVISHNRVDGFSNGYGVISVTQSSASITGTNTFWCNLTNVEPSLVNAQFMIEGDPTIYRVVSVTTNTALTLSPSVVRTSASGLRYRISNTGDSIGIGDVNYSTIEGNVVTNSHGNGLGITTISGNANYNQIIGNVASTNDSAGFSISTYFTNSTANFNTISNNTFTNNGAGNSRVSGFSTLMDGIMLDPGSNNGTISQNIFMGNTIADTRGSPTQQYGIGFNPYGVSGGNGRVTDNAWNNNIIYGNINGDSNNDSVLRGQSYLSVMRPKSGPLTIVWETSGSATEIGALTVTGDSTHTLGIGYYVAGPYAWFQSTNHGGAYTNLELNPSGGLVGLPSLTWAGIGTPTKAGDAAWCSNCTIGACSTSGTGALAVYNGTTWVCK
jgi:hypothetical protein